MTARLLDPLRGLGWTVLHDRRVPGSAANVDHLVIGPNRAWLIDSKAWDGRIKLLGDGRLWYGRTCLDNTIQLVRWAAARVEAVLAEAAPEDGFALQAVICMHGARLPRSPLRWDGVVLTEAKDLFGLIARSDSMFPDAAAMLRASGADRLLRRAQA